MDVIDRINLIIETEPASKDSLSQRTGISHTRWTNVLQRKAKLRREEIEAIGKARPEYMLWLAYGEELSDAGQISPMTKAAQKELGTQKKA
ncbi:XRE family transcriptional regulator [Cellvibrio sp. PSBB006]|uniref:XRE family transcriptional regulator n=1 Tax=Cellvibrio sp. PSBB006 TaxID=1987723 RepID=UPI000B56A8BF|nr:XRE family transcriptional regulator [Cellvibrio sp. PSBB006]ARU27789.1 hypothetical protein CBR65_10320 [Cellvibrio sp. PSBB006]